MFIRVILMLFVLLPGVAAASAETERLQSVRSLAFNVCSALLVFYNPNQGDRDPRYLDRYRQALSELWRLVEEEDDRQSIEAVREMKGQIEQLEQQSSDSEHLYPAEINRVLRAQAQIDRRKAEQYSSSTDRESVRHALHSLILNVDRLHLIYQARTFGALTVYSVDKTFLQLDELIRRGFSEIEEQWRADSSEIKRLQTEYEFIRPRLLDNQQNWVASGAAYYLGRVSDGLNRLDLTEE